jgi:hypothetical protein
MALWTASCTDGVDSKTGGIQIQVLIPNSFIFKVRTQLSSSFSHFRRNQRFQMKLVLHPEIVSNFLRIEINYSFCFNMKFVWVIFSIFLFSFSYFQETHIITIYNINAKLENFSNCLLDIVNKKQFA